MNYFAGDARFRSRPMSLVPTGPPQAIPEISLRPEQPADESFLRDLYASTREAELAIAGWGASMRRNFVEMQFRAQRQGYRSQFPQAESSVVLADGVPAGRLLVDRSERELRVVDLALLPQYRGRGIGTRLLQALGAEAVEGGKSFRLHVLKTNRAVRLYERLGFCRRAEDACYFEMEWKANSGRTK